MLTLWLKQAQAKASRKRDNLAESCPLLDSTIWQSLICQCNMMFNLTDQTVLERLAFSTRTISESGFRPRGIYNSRCIACQCCCDFGLDHLALARPVSRMHCPIRVRKWYESTVLPVSCPVKTLVANTWSACLPTKMLLGLRLFRELDST